MVRSLKWSDKIRWKEKNWLSLLNVLSLRWDRNTIQILTGPGNSKNDMLSMTLPYASAKVGISCFSWKRRIWHSVPSSRDDTCTWGATGKTKEKTPEELVPKEYHKFLKVFSKKESECMPLQKPWDHAIDLKNMFKLKKGHIIPLSPAEQAEVTVFLDDQLKKGYIRPYETQFLCIM